MQFYTLLTTLALVKSSVAGYAVEDDYGASDFFGMFDFFTDSDPTHGFVQYVDQSTAQNNGLVNSTSSSVYMGVDSTGAAGQDGRKSVRLTSKKSYNDGLVILDLAHMPGGVCGTWPAFWMVGPSWPTNGEIDIIEGVNSQKSNAMTLHTGPNCDISTTGGFSGKVATNNCDVNAAGQAQNAGCSIDTDDDSTYGDGFNSAGGGVYATEWTGNSISVYHFPRSKIPSDITSGSPNPSSWGSPLAQFKGTCDISNIFKDQQIVFDITFCGDWAGNVWSTDQTCSSKASTCEDYVKNNPSAFADSYWQINSLKVYKTGASTPEAEPQPVKSSSAKPVPATTLKTSTKAAPSTTSTIYIAPVPQTTLPSASPATSQPAASPPESAASPAASPQQGQPLMFGWFGEGSSGIPGKVKHRRHAEQHLKAHQRRFAHGHTHALF